MPPRMPTSPGGCTACSSRASPRKAATRIYERVDRPLIPVVAQMERHGIKVDRERLAGLSTEFAQRDRARWRRRSTRWPGEPFTIGSPKQLGDMLFDKMG